MTKIELAKTKFNEVFNLTKSLRKRFDLLHLPKEIGYITLSSLKLFLEQQYSETFFQWTPTVFNLLILFSNIQLAKVWILNFQQYSETFFTCR